MKNGPGRNRRDAEVDDLRARLAEAEDALRAVRNGELDAVVIAGERGERRVYSLSGADRLYRMLIETMSEGAATLSADRVILYCNARLAQMVGQPLDQVLGTDLRDYLPTADQSALDAVLAEVDTTPIRREINLKAGDGRLVPVYLCASRLPTDEAELVFGLVLTDMTEQKCHERLSASEVRYRRLFESAKDGILILDAETGMVVDVNPFLIELLGLSREAFLGKAIWELGFFTDIVANQASFSELQQMEYIRYEDKPLKTADGRRIDVEFVSNVYLVNRRKVIQCNIRDITERKRAERALRQSEERFRYILDNAQEAIWSADMAGQYEDMSPIMAQIYGRPLLELMSNPAFWIEAVHPADLAIVRASNDELRRNDHSATEYRIVLPDGTVRWISDRKTLLRDKHGETSRMAGIVSDITERKQAEAERDQMQAQLLQAQKLESIGTLAGGVAHEINNPVMGIMNYAQLIVDHLGPDNPATDYATEIGKETQRVATIVKNLLSFARLDKETHKSPARLCDIVEETLSLIRAVMRHDQITMEVNVPADLPKILCRSQQIRQVLMNLLTNARDTLNQKYPGHDANKIVRVRAREGVDSDQSPVIRDRLSAEKAGPNTRRWLRLTVEDHGTGIPQDLRERMFNPFFSTKARHRGTGLGLSISHGIVSDHGGTLSVESEVGQWTRFQVDLPIAAGAP